MEQLGLFINEAFRDIILERGLDVSYLPTVTACLSGYIRHGVFMWRDISTSREEAWEVIRSRLAADCILQQVPNEHRQSLMTFIQFAFEQVSDRCNEADRRAFIEGGSQGMPLDMNEFDSDSDVEVEFPSPGPIAVRTGRPGGMDIRSVLTRLIYQQTLRRFLHEASQYEDRDDGLTTSVTDTFPRFQYSSTGDGVPTTDTTCVVCQDDFAEGANCLRIPTCQHFFHEDCILPWLHRRRTCPTCREVCVEGDEADGDESIDSYLESDDEYSDYDE